MSAFFWCGGVQTAKCFFKDCALLELYVVNQGSKVVTLMFLVYLVSAYVELLVLLVGALS